LSNDPTITRVAKAICARETGYSGGPNVCGKCREARYDPEYGTPVDVPEGCLGLGYTYLAQVALTAAASPPQPDALKLAETALQGVDAAWKELLKHDGYEVPVTLALWISEKLRPAAISVDEALAVIRAAREGQSND
jgi:hypothetical protein